MKNLARMKWALLTAALGIGAGGAIMGGCTSDDSSTPPPADGSVDGNQTDSGVLDARTQFDVGAPNILTWVEQVTRLYCLKAAQCCGPAVFDVDKCVVNYMAPPGRGAVTNYMIRPFLDGGKMEIDPTVAQKCYDDINALSCGQTSTSLNQTFADCIHGAKGTIPVGQFGCAGSPECAPENHCDMPSDGGTIGTCAPLRPQNAACDVGVFQYDGGPKRGATFIYEPQAECGYLTSGKPNYCNNADAYDGYHHRFDGGTPQCEPQLTAGSPCYKDFECATNLCEPQDSGPSTCSDQAIIGTHDLCTFNQKTPDAGADGSAVMMMKMPSADDRTE